MCPGKQESSALKALHHRLIFILILIAMPILFLWKVLFLPFDLNYDDMVLFYDIKSILYKMGMARRLFLWNPYEFGGMDCIGDIQKGIFYPLSILYYSLPTGFATSLYAVLHLIMIGLFTYLFLCNKKISRSACLCGAVTLTFSSFVVLHITSPAVLGVICWFPLLLYIVERGEETAKLEYAIYSAFVLVVMLFSGNPQMFYYCGLIFGLLLLFRIVCSLRAKKFHMAGYFLLFMFIAVLVWFCLSAIQLLPFLELSRFTFREGGTSPEFSDSFSVAPKMLKALIVPFIFGNPYGKGYTGDWLFFDGVYYFGIFPLFLAFIGIFNLRDRLKDFYFTLIVLAFGAAMGRSFIFFWVFYKLLPFYSYFRAHGRLMFFVEFILAVFAAYGMNFLLSGMDWNSQRRAKKLVTSITILMVFSLLFVILSSDISGEKVWEVIWALMLTVFSAIVLWGMLNGRIGRRAFVVVSIILVFLDLWAFGGRYIQKVPRSEATKVPEPYSAVSQVKGLFRLCTNTDPRINDYYIRANVRFDCSSIQGSNPLVSSDYINYLFYNEMNALPSGIYLDRLRIPNYAFNIINYRSPMIALLNCRYFFVYDESAHSIVVRESSNYVKRFFLIDHFVVEKDREKILAFLSRDDYKSDSFVFLEEKPDEHAIDFMKKQENKPSGGTRIDEEVKVEEYSYDRYILSISTTHPAILFCSEIYHPGWKAKIDETPVKIFRANYIFRALLIPSGYHTVTMWYEPGSFVRGKKITLASLVILILLGIVKIYNFQKIRHN